MRMGSMRTDPDPCRCFGRNVRLRKYQLYRCSLSFQKIAGMIIAVDHEGNFTGGHELAHKIVSLPEIQLLSSQVLRKYFALFLAVIVQERSEPVVGLIIHSQLSLPFWREQIVDPSGGILILHQVPVHNKEQPLRENAIEVTFVVSVAGTKP